MSGTSTASTSQRLLVLAPTGRDAALIRTVFDANGLACASCQDMAAVSEELHHGADGLLIAEEALAASEIELREWLTQQPSWSDLPILVLARPGADSSTVARTIHDFGNVAVIERPVRIASIVSAARAALRSRQRQYQIRDYLEERKRTEEALREADRRKNDFLAMLAHELRNPLAPIRNALEIVRLQSPADSAAARMGPVMERQVNQLVHLVDDLLEVSRIARGKIELRKEPLDLAAVARSAMETSRPLIQAKQQGLSVSIPDESVCVDGDFVRLNQVIANLLNNASKYTHAGGSIRLTLRQHEGKAQVAVRDNGIGIEPDMLEQIFEPFIQIGRELGGSQQGLGIGLSLAKMLVEMHGGTIHARSEGAGKGSEFVLSIPLCDASLVSAAPDHAAQTSALSQQRILIVDDNQDAAESLGILLKMFEAEVHIVNDGIAAVQAFQMYKPSVVLLDIGLPDIDGYEVARRIRQIAVAWPVTLIALTGWGQDEDRRNTREAGCDFHLTKPPDFNELMRLLEVAKNRSAVHAANRDAKPGGKGLFAA
jgi:signal transduction histidine kinase/ActR/RegA family two-component response regulator